MDQRHFESPERNGSNRPLDHSIDDLSTKAHQVAATLGEALEAGIHQRPLAAVAIAAVVGYALARLIHRR